MQLRYYVRAILVAAIAFFPVAALAAEPESSGSIGGTVVDASTGEALPGANIVIKGTSVGTASDTEGRFLLRRVDSGELTLVVSFLGYETKEVVVDVSANSRSRVDVQLQDGFVIGQDIVVVGIQRGQARAFNEQRRAANIRNVVSSEQLERFPDPHVAAALTRVPGVSTTHDRGEPGAVRIRGLGPNMGYVMVDGQRMASTSDAGRGSSVTTITTDLISSIEVTKAFTPDQHADAVSGTVNLITRRPIGHERIFNATLGAGYSELANRANYQGAVSYGQRSDRLSYVVNASYRQDNRLQEDIRHRWEKIDFGNGPQDVLARLTPSVYPIVRDRIGLTASFDYMTTETASHFLRTSLTRRVNQEERHQVELMMRDRYLDAHTTTGLRGRAELNSRMYDRTTTQFNATTGGRHLLPAFNLDYSIGYAIGLEENNPQRSFLWRAEGFDYTFDYSNRRAATVAMVGGSLEDPAIFSFQRYEVTQNQAIDHDLTLQSNIEVPFQLSGSEGALKFGGHLTSKIKDVTRSRERAIGYDGQLSAADMPLSARSLMNGRYNIPYAIDWNVARNYYPENRDRFILADDYNAIYSTEYDYRAHENIAATYGMATVEIGRVLLLGGLRMERTGMSYRGNQLMLDEDGVLVGTEPADVSRVYYDLFPAGHLRYAMSDRTNFRLAATRTLARPNFRSLAPYRTENHDSQSLSVGNPYLDPMRSTNLDLLVEHYFMNVGILSGGVFYKDVRDFVYTESREIEVGEYAGWRESRPVNGDWARVWGFEAAWQQSLSFLPGMLRGLGIYANYTYTGSEADYGRPQMMPLAQATPHIVNAALSFDRAGFSAQASYNYMSTTFWATSTYLPQSIINFYAADGHYPDRYRRAFGQLDLSASMRVTPQMRVFAEVNNLLNKSNLDYHMFEKYPYRENIHSWQANLGLRMSL
jgi:TonB-dependent receptor